MTDWHCQRCKKHIRVHFHTPRVFCDSCGRHLTKGTGRHTRHDPWAVIRLTPYKRLRARKIQTHETLD